MKHLFRSILFIISICLSFTSCEKDGIDNSLVGKWICEEHIVEMSNGKTYRYTNENEWYDYDNEILMDYTMTFSKDGTLTADTGTPGTYSVNGNIISIMGIPTYKYSIKGKQMVLEHCDAFLAYMNTLQEIVDDPTYIRVVGYYNKQ